MRKVFRTLFLTQPHYNYGYIFRRLTERDLCFNALTLQGRVELHHFNQLQLSAQLKHLTP